MDLAVFSNKKGDIFVEADNQEIEIFWEFEEHVRAIFRRKKKQVMMVLNSYMRGFMDSNYPVKDDGNPECPKCGTEMVWSSNERRFTCPCGYKTKKYRQKKLDVGSYMSGLQNSKKLLK